MYPKYQKLLLLFAGCLFTGFTISSCGTANSVSPAGSTTKVVVVNTIPDIGPLALLLDNFQLGGTAAPLPSRTLFRYTSTPVFYTIKTQDSILFQLQAHPTRIVTALTVKRNTASNTSYSYFLMGIAGVDSLTAVFTTDTTKLPSLGHSKIRFINASPRTPGLNVSINGSAGFTNIAYTKVSKYVELPAGMYEFKLTANGSSTNTLNTLSRVTVLDGKVYTLFSKGLVGRTDSAAISLNVITQK